MVHGTIVDAVTPGGGVIAGVIVIVDSGRVVPGVVVVGGTDA